MEKTIQATNFLKSLNIINSQALYFPGLIQIKKGIPDKETKKSGGKILIKTKKGVNKINFLQDFWFSEEGISRWLVLILIVLLVLLIGGGFIIYQLSGFFQLGSETIQVMSEVLEEIEDREDIEGIEDIDNLEDIEALSDLEVEDIEELEELAPIAREIYSRLPQGLIDILQDDETAEPELIEEELVEEEETEILKKSDDDFLPNSLEMHPRLKFVDYQTFEDVPEFYWEEVKEEYINENSVLLTYEPNFLSREIAELRELEQVPDEITDEMIIEEKEHLEEIYNIFEIVTWFEERLPEEGWKLEGESEGLEDKLFYKHEQDGYFIMFPPEDYLYTPRR